MITRPDLASETPEYRRLLLKRANRLRDLRAELDRIQEPVLAYYDDFPAFARECVNWGPGEGIYPYQADIGDLLVQHHRASLRSLRGAGKSMVAALIIWWFALTRDAAAQDWKIPTTASSWNQLTNYLWPEIRKWGGKLDWDTLRDGRRLVENKEIQNRNVKLRYGNCFAAASQNPGKIEGAHATQLLFVFDEAKLIPAATFDAAEGALTGHGAYALMLSTPGDPAGRFYDVQRRATGYEDWAVRAVTLDEVLEAGQITREWVDQRRLQWGEDSAVFRNHVLGEFHAADEGTVIPLRWLEAAHERWREWDAAGRPEPRGRRIVGVDVARFGTDRTVFAVRQGPIIQRLEEHAKEDTMRTTGRVVPLLHYPKATAVVDVVGVGGGVVDRLRELKKPVIGFNAAQKSTAADATGELGFFNLRAEVWWQLREALDPRNGPTLAIPEDVELTGELTSPKWWQTSSGKIRVEAKEDIHERIGRSTDRADAVVQANWQAGSIMGPDDSNVRGWTDPPLEPNEAPRELPEDPEENTIGWDADPWEM